MLIVQAVTYYKRSGEFRIKYRDAATGKPVIYNANRLRDNERIFCETCTRSYEGPESIVWAASPVSK